MHAGAVRPALDLKIILCEEDRFLLWLTRRSYILILVFFTFFSLEVLRNERTTNSVGGLFESGWYFSLTVNLLEVTYKMIVRKSSNSALVHLKCQFKFVFDSRIALVPVISYTVLSFKLPLV